MGQIGFREILVILLIVIILFGAKRIPELMRGMGQGIKEFKGGMKDPDALPPSTQPPTAPPPADDKK